MKTSIAQDIASVRRLLLSAIDAHDNLEIHMGRENSVYVTDFLMDIERRVKGLEKQQREHSFPGLHECVSMALGNTRPVPSIGTTALPPVVEEDNVVFLEQIRRKS